MQSSKSEMQYFNLSDWKKKEVTGGVDEPTVPACAKFLRIQGEWGRRSEKPERSDEGGEAKEMT